jgi:hypothetical protein
MMAKHTTGNRSAAREPTKGQLQSANGSSHSALVNAVETHKVLIENKTSEGDHLQRLRCYIHRGHNGPPVS